jgi:hypothetical protein
MQSNRVELQGGTGQSMLGVERLEKAAAPVSDERVIIIISTG